MWLCALQLNTAEGALNDALQKNLLIKISAESIVSAEAANTATT